MHHIIRFYSDILKNSNLKYTTATKARSYKQGNWG